MCREQQGADRTVRNAQKRDNGSRILERITPSERITAKDTHHPNRS